jgi:hypothetical protein
MNRDNVALIAMLKSETNMESKSYRDGLHKFTLNARSGENSDFWALESLKFMQNFSQKTSEDLLFKLPLVDLNAYTRVLPDTPETSHLLQRHIMRYRKPEKFDLALHVNLVVSFV